MKQCHVEEGRHEQALTGHGKGKEKLRSRTVRKVGDGRRPRTLYRGLLQNLPNLHISMSASFTCIPFSAVRRKKTLLDLKGCPVC